MNNEERARRFLAPRGTSATTEGELATEFAAAEMRGRQRGTRDGLLLALQLAEDLLPVCHGDWDGRDLGQATIRRLRDLIDQHPDPRGGTDW